MFTGTSRYLYGQSLGDVFRGIVRYIPRVTQIHKPMEMKGIQTYLKVGSNASKEGATVKDVIKSTLKPTVGTVLGATLDKSPSS